MTNVAEVTPEYERATSEYQTPPEILQTVTDTILGYETTTPLLVLINGKDASGKTILADNVARHLREQTTRPIERVSFDNFLNHSSLRNAAFVDEGRGSYEYAFNYHAFEDYFLQPLKFGDKQTYVSKVYDLPSDTELEPVAQTASEGTIFIVDGLFLLRPELRKYWDVSVLLDAPVDTLVARGVARDADIFGGVEPTRQRYKNRYMPSQEIYFREAQPRERADIIINNADPTRATIAKQ